MSLHYCAELVERGDPDRFAATLAAPVAVRPQLWPLYALNLELARAPWASAEPLLAEMRLQWWIDALADLAAGKAASGQEVLAEVAVLLARTPALAPVLLALAQARRRDCWREAFADTGALAAYIDATSGNLMWAAALALGAPAVAQPVVRDFALGAGLANWLRAVPALRARGQTPLPDDSPAAIATLAGEGLARLAQARAAGRLLPAACAPALFPGWLAAGVLRRAAARPARVAAGQLGPSEFARRAGLLVPAFLGRW
jgi:phytoene/squalene synthetase